VNPAELAFGAVVVPVLLGLAGYFAWRQRRTLQSLRTNPDLSPDERGYLRAQAWRRLACCALMVILAGLLAGSYFFEGPRLEWEEVRKQAAPGEEPQDEYRTFARYFVLYLIMILLVLLLLLVLMVVDVFAIARFAARQHRKLREDYRAALQSEITRLRGERNGHK
jgi:hypothetical protein